MRSEDIMLAVVDALDAASIPYVLVGSFSSNIYGIPRTTQDADFVLELGQTPIAELARHLGPGFQLDPQMRFETVIASHCYVLTRTDSPFKVELFLLQDEEYHRTRFARRRQVAVEGRQVWVPSPEDVIITKLRWSRQGRRTKDLLDVTDVLSVQTRRRTPLDWDYIHRWCDVHRTRELLDRIRRELPPM